WCTDVHLDHIEDQDVISFAERINKLSVDGVVLTGDISIAGRLVLHLSLLERVLQVPVYFVLGNHDYWGGEIAAVRKQMRELSNLSGFLRYLPTSPYTVLTPNTAIVGHDGWYDALYGDYENSRFIMRDWHAISDFVTSGAMETSLHGKRPVFSNLVPKCRELAHEAVQHMHDGIKSA